MTLPHIVAIEILSAIGITVIVALVTGFSTITIAALLVVWLFAISSSWLVFRAHRGSRAGGTDG
jgi:hypothetical protein